MYSEYFSPKTDKIFAFGCFVDRNNRNNDIAKKVELK